MRWLFTLLLLTACDDLNRPMGHPTSPRPLNAPPTSGSAGDGGAPTTDDAAAPSPAPTITAQPGDIQI